MIYAAAHVVCDPLADISPGQSPYLDWDATLAYRRHLWSLGLAVAEAMDTAQRGNGLDWTASQELIRRSLAESAWCRHDAEGPSKKTSRYEEQCGFSKQAGII